MSRSALFDQRIVFGMGPDPSPFHCVAILAPQRPVVQTNPHRVTAFHAFDFFEAKRGVKRCLLPSDVSPLPASSLMCLGSVS